MHKVASLPTIYQMVLMGALFFTPISPFISHVFLAAIILLALLKPDTPWRQLLLNPVVILAGLLFTLFCFSLIYSAGSWDAGVHNLHKYSKLLYIPLIMMVALDIDFDRVMQVFCSAMVMIAILSILKSLGFLAFLVSGGSDSVFHNHIYMGFMLGVAAFYLFLSLLNQPRWRWIKALALGIILWHLLFVNQGRTGYLILAGLITLSCYQLFAWRGLLLAVLVSGVLFTSAYFGADKFKHRIGQMQAEAQLFQQDPTQYTSIGARLLFTTHSLLLIISKPIIGYGVGSFPAAYYEKFPLDVQGTDGLGEPHNEFINIAFQLGLIGLAIFIFYLSALWVTSWDLELSQQHFLQGVILAFILGACCDDFLMLSPTGYSFILLTSILCAQWYRQKKQLDYL